MIAEKLRKAVLQAAIQGKLTTQSSEDSDVSVYLRDIKKTKNLLIEKGSIKKNNKILDVDDSDIIYKIPDNWEWVSLHELTSLITDGTHHTPQYVDNGVPFLSVQNISSGTFDFSKLKYISELEHNKLIERAKPELNDILICRIGTLGKPIIVDLDFEFSIFVSLGLIKLLDFKYVKYLKIVLSSPLMDKWIEKYKVGGGTHTNKLNLRDLQNVPIPFPPIEEQKRIVEKLEILLAEIDKLEEDEKALKDLEDKIPEKLKNAILHSAFIGKLTHQTQDYTNEPFVPDEVYFEIPSTWEIKTMNEVSNIITGNSIPVSLKSAKYSNVITGYPYIATKDLNFDGSIDYDNGVKIPYGEEKFRIAKPQNTLICIEGGSAGRKIGFLHKEVAFGNKLCSFEPLKVDYKYLYYFLQCPIFQTQFKNGMTGMIGGVGINKIREFKIPVPLIEEQIEIVKKLDNFFNLFN